MASVLERNNDLQSHVPVKEIPHGTDIPFRIMHYYLQQIGRDGYFVLDLGCGRGETAAEFVRHGYGVMAMDINPDAVAHARTHDVHWAVIADATTFEVKDAAVEKLFHNWYGGVVLKAILCNLPGDGWKQALRHSVEALKPGGFVFLSETLLAPEYNPDLEISTGKAPGYEEFLGRWKKRYATNVMIGLPYGTIVVARPGTEKFLEYGIPRQLQEIIESDKLERFVTHFGLSELCGFIESLGMTNKELHRTVWQSRENMPLNGVWGVWQKN